MRSELVGGTKTVISSKRETVQRIYFLQPDQGMFDSSNSKAHRYRDVVAKQSLHVRASG